MDDNVDPATVLRTEAEINEIIAEQEREESKREFHGMSMSEFEVMLKLEILDEARRLKIIPPSFGREKTEQDKLETLKRQKFAVWFLWDGLNVVRAERGLIANIYVHTSGKDIIHNRDIWKMIRSALNRCHNKEGGLIESTELEVRSKMLEWHIGRETKRLLKQTIEINDKEEEFDLVPDFRILRNEQEIYQVTLTDRKSGLKATGRGNIKYRNQIDWATKLELSRRVREFEYRQELEERRNGNT